MVVKSVPEAVGYLTVEFMQVGFYAGILKVLRVASNKAVWTVSSFVLRASQVYEH